MKKIIFLFAIVLAVTSCKEDTKNETAVSVQEDDTTLLRGEFIYLGDAAVLNCGNKIYGVVIDNKMHELADMVAAKKKEEYDMVPVVIRGVVSPKTTDEEGWPEVVTIKKILKVLEPTGESAVKIESGETTGK